VLSSILMRKAKPILLLWAVLLASLGGCFGPLMMGARSMDCCASMPCNPAGSAQNCCTARLPGAGNNLQQTAEVTAPTVAYAVLATLPHVSASPNARTAMHRELRLHCDSPPGELYTVHHSFLI